MIPEAVRRWLSDGGYGTITTCQTVGGGCINQGQRIGTASGQSFFLKTNPQSPVGMFACEANGLEALRIPGGPRVPQPFLAGDNYLLLEDLAPAAPRPDYWSRLGRELAHLHCCTQPRFGFNQDNYIGSTPQPNPWTTDGYEFFANQRLLYQARLAYSRGRLPARTVHAVENLARRLPDLVPSQPASLIHGDLWSGNVISDEAGNPAIIDPAVHFGWAEAELAMTDLFGSFPGGFYRAYTEIRPLEPGFRQRYPLYNLYHLLNHVNLFGSAYVDQVQSIINRFA